MWMVMLLGCRQPGVFVKVVMESTPCALTSTGRVTCWESVDGEDFAWHWLDVPRANDLAAVSTIACSSGTSGVNCYYKTGSRGGHWPNHTAGKYTQVAMTDHNMCTLNVDGVVECFGDSHLTLDGGGFVEIGTDSSVCGLNLVGGVECASPDRLANPELNGTYDHLTHGYSDRICGLTDGVPDCWPKDGDYYVKPPEGVTFTDLHLGDGVICGVQTNGELMCWPYEGDDCLSAGEKCPDEVIENVPTGTFSQVWANVDTACAVDTDGCMTCWPSDLSWAGDQRICTEDIEQ